MLFNTAPFSKFVAVRAQTVPSFLPAYRIEQFPLPNGSLQPWGITVDNSGKVWFVEEQSNQIGMFDPLSETFREFNVTTPNSLLEEISIDNYGNPWFTELNGERIGELNVKTGTILEFPIPVGPGNLACGPIGVTVQNNSIWITCEFSNQIDEFFLQNSTFHSFNLPVFYSAPLQIVFDSGGNLWFTAADSEMIGHATITSLSPGTSKGIQEFAPTNTSYLTTITSPQPPPGLAVSRNTTIVSSLQTPSQLAISPNGNILWITEHVSSSFDEYNTTSKVLDKFWTSQTHDPNYANSLPNGIAIGKSGIIWIAEHYGNKIAEFDPRTRQMLEYPIPCCGSQLAGTLYLALGDNSAVWFTEFYGNQIGELVPTNNSNYISVSPVNSSIVLPATGANLSLPLRITSESENVAQNVTLDVSELTQSGVLSNSSVTFNPDQVTLKPNVSRISDMILKTQNLQSGSYFLTVSAKSSLTGILYSMMISLIIVDSHNYSSLLTNGLVIGLVLAFVTIVSLAIASRRMSSRSRISRRPRR